MGRYDNMEISCLSDALERLDGKEAPDMGDFEDVFRELYYVLDLVLEPQAAACSHSIMMRCREYRIDLDSAPSPKEIESICAAWEVDSLDELRTKAKSYIEFPLGLTREEAVEVLDDLVFKKQETRNAALAAETAQREKETADALATVRVKKEEE
jgi:hypothetical protein